MGAVSPNIIKTDSTGGRQCLWSARLWAIIPSQPWLVTRGLGYVRLIGPSGRSRRLPDIFYPDPEIRMDGGQHGREFPDKWS